MSLNHTVSLETLPNGISLVTIPLASTAAATILVFMGVGSRFESTNQLGLAHFTEHMVFKGGDRYPTAQAIAQALDAVGGHFNAFTSQEYTAFYTKVAAQDIAVGIDVLSDMLLHAKFPADELEKEKGVIVEEINMYEDMPQAKVDQVFSALSFGDTPLGRPIIGTKQSVTAFTSEDFLRYRQQFYKGSACTIAIAGSFNHDEVRALVEEKFGAMPSGTAEVAEVARFAQHARVALETKQSEQTHLIVGVPAVDSMDDRYYVQKLLCTILGGTMSSRLFVSVREEQGLCYYVHASNETYQDAGMIVASAGVDNNRLPQAITAILKEFRKIREFGVTPEELERGKHYLSGATLLGMEDSFAVANYYAKQHQLEGTQDTPADALAKVQAVTAEDIQKLAHEFFTDAALRLAVIGPHHDVHALESLLTI